MANFDGGHIDNLAVGVPDDDVGATNAGAVNVLHGTGGGLTAPGDQFWHQEVSGVEEESENGDHFGRALAVGDFDGDGYLDLAVGVPDEDVGDPAVALAGAVNVLYGAASGLTATGNEFWYQGHEGIYGAAEENDHFGWALAAIPLTVQRVYLPIVLR